MNALMLYLLTRGRVDDQLTLKSLPRPWRERTIIVCPTDEARLLGQQWSNVYKIETPPITELYLKRKWIFEHSISERICMLDDDLRFHSRRWVCHELGGLGRVGDDKLIWEAFKRHRLDATVLELIDAKDTRMNRLFKRLETMLDTYAHGGVNGRFMSHTVGNEFKMNSRCLHVLAYHVPTVKKVCELGRIQLSHDYDYTLQLLRAGYENAIYCWTVQDDPKGYHAPGGLSLYRTPAMVAHAGQQLATLHPGIVRLQPYHDNSPYVEFGMRTVANWKKAIKEGLEKRGVKHGTISGGGL